MIHLSYIFVTFANVMEQLKEKYERFKEWQKKPYEVRPLSTNEHTCATCHTQFQGNYCPRCGQSATIGRYSFKTAFLLFLDVWGLGNRGMFRSIRDLILRPGYMIRDYLNGMQMAYFPPFKMFFLLIALNVLVESGFNVKMQNIITKSKESIFNDLEKAQQDIKTIQMKATHAELKDTIKINGKRHIIEKAPNDDNSITIDGKKKDLTFREIIKRITDWMVNNETLVQLFWLLLLSGPLYLFFRHNKKIPDVRYSEFFVSMVYITNMMTIYDIVSGFFLPGQTFTAAIVSLATFIPLKQLYGYSYLRTVLKVIGAIILLISAICLLAILIVILAELILDL